MFGLIFGQVYASDLWIVFKHTFALVFLPGLALSSSILCGKKDEDNEENERENSRSPCMTILLFPLRLALAIVVFAITVIITVAVIIGQITPGMLDAFSYPFAFFS